MKPDKFAPIVKEYERQKAIKTKGGVRLFTDEYLIYSLSLRFAKSQSKIIEILELQPPPPKTNKV